MTESTPSMQRPDPAVEAASMFPHEDGQPVLALTEEQCWQLLERVRHARLGTRIGDRIDIIPVNIAARGGRIWFRTAPGTKLLELTASPDVVVQADGVLSDQAWSVQVRGTARELTTSAEIEEAEALEFESWVPTIKQHYVVVEPTETTGRHFLFGAEPVHPTYPTD
ncbi:pyridoxamine 5'-phosphate oxidase family protein [Micrococcus sp.]|uniref:pyridoxamine 5'-phosphate oxidase family protein n=1 Tax=Micrococcus sp. TaxID=1271 RepID=UPI002A91ACAB|nr:pyridoxamine 5'-phosphate oxidase family protein [Micrococcus sp.]MDY6055750.1 pyridoxamine 5'-phosphate oxidase family protein [Micrococcus sp.]